MACSQLQSQSQLPPALVCMAPLGRKPPYGALPGLVQPALQLSGAASRPPPLLARPRIASRHRSGEAHARTRATTLLSTQPASTPTNKSASGAGRAENDTGAGGAAPPAAALRSCLARAATCRSEIGGRRSGRGGGGAARGHGTPPSRRGGLPACGGMAHRGHRSAGAVAGAGRGRSEGRRRHVPAAAPRPRG